MLTALAEKLQWPDWADLSSRYRRLTVLDRLLDGTIYDDLEHSFYEEETPDGKYIKIEDRRPCVRYNLPKYIAKTTARKLFAGAHAPKLTHSSEEVVEKLKTLANSSNLFYYMLQASIWASVGSVAATFKIVDDRFLIEIWRSRFCWPTFKSDGQLDSLRIAYPTKDWPAGAVDWEGKLVDAEDENYWFIRDVTDKAEITYRPICEDDWNPIEGPDSKLVVEKEVFHKLGFVPAQWGVNLAGGEFPDGDSTFGPAIDMSIEMDYTMSQIGAGVRYNAAPQVVLQGDLADGDSKGINRGPSRILHLKAPVKDATGMTFGGGDAHLLEMTGTGTDAGVKYIAALRKFALETVAAARKDPERTKGPLSGKAVEALDDQFVDLVQELRSSLGDTFMLSLLKKMVLAGIETKHPLFKGMSKGETEEIGVIWKRAIPTPPEALVQVSSAMEKFLEYGLIEPDQAKRFVHMILDLDALEDQEAVTNVMSTDPAPSPTPLDSSEPRAVDINSTSPTGHFIGRKQVKMKVFQRPANARKPSR